MLFRSPAADFVVLFSARKDWFGDSGFRCASAYVWLRVGLGLGRQERHSPLGHKMHKVTGNGYSVQPTL